MLWRTLCSVNIAFDGHVYKWFKFNKDYTRTVRFNLKTLFNYYIETDHLSMFWIGVSIEV